MAKFVTALGRDGVSYRINLDQIRHIAQMDGFQRVHFAEKDTLDVGAVNVPPSMREEADYGDNSWR